MSMQSKYTKTTCLAIEPEIFQRVKYLADKKTMGISLWIRQAINEKLERVDLLNHHKEKLKYHLQQIDEPSQKVGEPSQIFYKTEDYIYDD